MNWETDKAEDIGKALAAAHLQIVEKEIEKFHESHEAENVAALAMLGQAAKIEEQIKRKYGVDIHIEFTVKVIKTKALGGDA